MHLEVTDLKPGSGTFLIPLLFFYLLPHGIIARNYDFNERCLKAYQAVLNLRFPEARQLITLEKAGKPDNLIPAYIENTIDFLTLFIGEEKKQYDQIRPKFQARMDLLEKGDRDSPLYYFCLGEANLQWAIVQVKFGEYTRAAFKARRAFQCFNTNHGRFPDFIPNNIGLGISHILGGLIPESYRWIASLAGMEGTLGQGLDELRTVASYQGNDKVIQAYKTQALFYLDMISANLLKNKTEALDVLEQFDHRQSEQSPLIIFARASILMKNGHNEESLELLSKRIASPSEYPFYYLDYMHGLCLLNRLDTSAGQYFSFYLQHFRGINYIKAVWQKIAWLSFLKGDSSAYRDAMEHIRISGNSIVDEDKQAGHEAGVHQYPNLYLLQSRLLFDGGYYEKALAVLLNNTTRKYLLTRKDFLEYTYRLGRIYQESENPGKAIIYYRQTIQRGKNDPWYFAASSALQMGLIYENAGELQRADSAFHVCLSCRTAEYKNSLGQKAKAGIYRIKMSRP